MPLRPILTALFMLTSAFARPAAAVAQPDVQMCTEQPVPAGYVVVHTATRSGCPSVFGAAYNTLTIRMPGDTVTVCSELSQLSEGYVVTRRAMRSGCPTTFGSASNTATYQRVGPPPAPQVPSGGSPVIGFAMLDPYDRTVYQRLDQRKASLGLEIPTHHPWLSKAPHGASEQASLPLEGGVRYTLVAVCDGDCTDLNLRVLDGGYVVAQDLQPEGYASVQLTPARNGTLTVEASMASCAQSPCHYAVAVYETPRPNAVPPRRPPGGDVRVNPRPRPRP